MTDELTENVAQIIHDAMRFERKDSTLAWVHKGNSFAQEKARDAARAALSAMNTRHAVAVKELEWDHEKARKYWPEIWRADSSVGEYAIERDAEEDPDCQYNLLFGDDHSESFGSLKEAKDYAQECFNQCISGGLTTGPVSVRDGE